MPWTNQRWFAVALGLLLLVAHFIPANAQQGEEPLLWQARFDTNAPSRPVIANGLVYVADPGVDRGDGIYALDLATGAEVWRPSRGATVDHEVVNDRVYAAAWDTMYALDALTGEQIWQYTVVPGSHNPYIDVDHLKVSDGLVYAWAQATVIGRDQDVANRLVALDATDGALVWEYLLPEAGISHFDVAEGVVAMTTATELIVLDAKERLALWSRKIEDVFDVHVVGWPDVSGPVVLNGSIYISNWEHDLFAAINVSDGSIRWVSPRINYFSNGRGDLDPIICQDGDILYIPGRSVLGLSAVNANSGAVIWTAEASHSFTPIAMDSVVWVGDSNSEQGIRLIGLDAATGSELWSFNLETESNIFMGAAISNEGSTLVVSTSSGVVNAITLPEVESRA